MNLNILAFISLFIFQSFNIPYQQVDNVYYFVEKGIYIRVEHGANKTYIPYTENVSYNFSIKNDSTAILQEVHNKKVGQERLYKISLIYDTAYLKKYTVGTNGKTKVNVEKMIFRKLYR